MCHNGCGNECGDGCDDKCDDVCVDERMSKCTDVIMYVMMNVDKCDDG